MTTNLSDIMYLPTYKQKIPGTNMKIYGKNQIINLSEDEPSIVYHTSISRAANFMKAHPETPYDEIYEIIPLDYNKLVTPHEPKVTNHFIILKKVTNLYDLPADMVHDLPYHIRLDILKTVIDKGFDYGCLYVLQDDPDEYIRKELALHTSDRDQLLHLTGDPEPGVRMAITERRVQEPELLRILANDYNDIIKAKAMEKLMEIKEAEEEHYRKWEDD